MTEAFSNEYGNWPFEIFTEKVSAEPEGMISL